MKKLKQFKILFRYLKEDKLLLIIYLVFSILRYFEPLLNAFIWANAFEAISRGQEKRFLIFLACWSGIIIFCWVFLSLPIDLIYNKLEKKFMTNVNKDLYAKVGNLPAVAFEEIGVGEFINRMYTDPDRILELLQKLIKLTCRLIIAIIIVVISFTVSLIVGLELVVLCIIMFVLSNIYYPKLKKINEDIKKEADEYVKVATQNITGIREIKALGIKENINNRVFNRIDSLFNKQKKAGKHEVWYFGINNLCYFTIQFLILFTLGHQYFNGIITLSSFIIIEKYIWRIDEVVESLSEFGVSFNKVTVSLKRISELLDNELYHDEQFGKKEITDNKCRIEFNNVFFKYRNDEDLILKGLTMDIKPNQKIAIVGRSGEGKSTLFNLLLRYFDSVKGSIKINILILNNYLNKLYETTSQLLDKALICLTLLL